MKKIAITGATGFLGRHLKKRLLSKGYAVTTLSRHGENNLKEKNLRLVTGDLKNRESVKDLTNKADIVCSLAAEVSNESRMISTNYDGAKLLFQESLHSKANTFIQLSSVGVYGQVSNLVKEDQKLTPLNSYETSKSLADKWLLDNFSEGMNLIILRPSNIFGPDMTNNHLRKLTEKISNQSYFFIGDKEYFVNYIYVENVLDAIEKLIEDNKKYNEPKIYNLNNVTPLEEFIGFITNSLGVERVKRRLPRVPVLIIVWLFSSVANFCSSSRSLSSLIDFS